MKALIESRKFQGVGPASRYIALMLWCGPRTPAEGICRMSRAAMVDLTGVDKTLDESLDRLREAKLIAWDPESEMLWAVGRAQQEVWTGRRSGPIKASARLSVIYKTARPLPRWSQQALQSVISADPTLSFWMARRWWPFEDLRFRDDMPSVEPEVNGEPASGFDILKERAEKLSERTEKPQMDTDMAVVMWNEVAASNGLPQVEMIHAERLKQIRGRLADTKGLEGFGQVIARVGASDYLCGRANTTFRATFDWVISPVNFTKIREGNFDNRTGRTANSPSDDARRLQSGLAAALGRERGVASGEPPSGGD